MERSLGFIWTLLLISAGTNWTVSSETQTTAGTNWTVSSETQTTASSECGGNLIKPSGRILTPRHPTLSMPIKCIWSIQMAPSYQILLSFPHLNLSCSNEYVEVFDGTITSPSLGKVCNGFSITYESSSNIMTIVFSRRSSYSTSRIDAYYYAKLKAAPTVSVPKALPCGGLLLTLKGTFSSPPKLGKYAHSVQCVWEIEVLKSYQIILNLNASETEHSLSCSSSYVDIFDGSQNSSKLLGRFCDAFNVTFLSSSNKLRIQYFSDSSVPISEFKASYFAIPQDNNDAALSCADDQMYVAVNRQYIQSLGYDVQHLSLNNASCEPEIIPSHIIFMIPFNSCGTVIEEKNDTIIYSNVISTKELDGLIARIKTFHLHLNCRMNMNNMVEVKYLTDDSIDIYRSQDGHFHLNVSFYDSSLFDHPVSESPYFIELNQDVFLQVMLSHFDPNLLLSVDTCVASPDAADFKSMTYDLIRHRCVRDPTYAALSSPNPNIVRFKFKAFRFLKRHNVIYLQCQMVICRATDASSQCQQSCTPRSKRETHPKLDHLEVGVGPLRLKKETSLDKNTSN